MSWHQRPRGGLVLLWTIGVLGAAALLNHGGAADVPNAPEGWMTYAPRDEIRPEFGYDARGGPDGKGALVIRADRREGLAGAWKKSFPVVGGKAYRFTARYQAEGVTVPRRSV